jgi:serine/threonine protein kinase
MDRYSKIEKSGVHQLGAGTYGEVYKARDMRSGDFVAMKRIKLSTEEEGTPSSTLREISTLKALIHPNIVQ